MPKNITSVLWEASSLPSGILFDSHSGTFSGSSSKIGKFEIPVKVTTNYGSDQKTLSINIRKAYPVFAIGNLAPTWSEGATPNANGFYKLNMPDAFELLPNYGGFGAIVLDNKYYCCGVFDVQTNSSYSSASSAFKFKNKPEQLEKVLSIRCGHAYYNYITGATTNPTTQNFSECFYILKKTYEPQSDLDPDFYDTGSLYTSKYHTKYKTAASNVIESWQDYHWEDYSSYNEYGFYKLSENSFTEDTNCSWLSDNGYSIVTLKSIAGSATKPSPNGIEKIQLDCRAIKLFATQLYSSLRYRKS